MARYFYDVFDGFNYIDKDGVELSSIEEAQIEMFRAASDLLRDSASGLLETRQCTISVRDDAGREILKIDIDATLTV